MVSHQLSLDNLEVTGVPQECRWADSDRRRTALSGPPAKGSLLTALSGTCLVCKLSRRKGLAVRDMGGAAFGGWRAMGTGGQLRDRDKDRGDRGSWGCADCQGCLRNRLRTSSEDSEPRCAGKGGNSQLTPAESDGPMAL